MYAGGTSKFVTSSQEATRRNSSVALAIECSDHPSNYQGTYVNTYSTAYFKLMCVVHTYVCNYMA